MVVLTTCGHQNVDGRNKGVVVYQQVIFTRKYIGVWPRQKKLAAITRRSYQRGGHTAGSHSEQIQRSEDEILKD